MVFAINGAEARSLKLPQADRSASEDQANSTLGNRAASSISTRQFLKTCFLGGAMALMDVPVLAQELLQPQQDKFSVLLNSIRSGSLDFMINHRRGGLLLESGPDFSRPVCNIAGEGFAFAALPIAVERGQISREDAAEIINQSLLVIENNPNLRHRGWITHMINVQDPDKPVAEIYSTDPVRVDSEFSSIDTTLYMFGALLAAEYFGNDQQIASRVNQLYGELDFNALLVSKKDAGESYFLSHGFSVVKGKIESIQWPWDTKSEGILVSLLALADPNPQIDKSVWYNWSRADNNLPLFTAYYPACFIDDRDRSDRTGFSIWGNTNRSFQRELEECRAEKLPNGLFGVTSCFATVMDVCGNLKEIYFVPPCNREVHRECRRQIIAPHAIVASLPFIPRQAEEAMRFLEETEALSSKYGPINSFNLADQLPNKGVTSIDVGSALLMLDAASDGIVHKLSKRSERIQLALNNAGYQNDPGQSSSP